MSVLTPTQVEQFYKDGYLKFKRVLSDEQVEDLRTDLDRVINRQLSEDELPLVPPEFGYGGGQPSAYTNTGDYAGPAIHQYINMWKVFPSYRGAMNNPLITAAMRELMEAGGVRIWHDQVISKPPHENKLFPCHHDYYFWPLDRPTMITAWLALDDATVENGCMHVIPGSHRDPRYQPADCDMGEDIHLSPVPGGPGEPGSLYQEIRTWLPDKAVPVELKAGECMFHHCLNYHMTPENVSERQRRALILIYMPDGTRYKHAQSPTHPCSQYLNLEDGSVMGGKEFPLCGETIEARV